MRLTDVGVHKQHANRLIETFAWHTVIVTSTEWANWDALRISKMAQPEMFKTAGMMREVRLASEPSPVNYGDWHLPLVPDAFDLQVRKIDPVKVCVGRCAAVSFNRQEETTAEKAAMICDKLRADGHMSPFEHALRPMTQPELSLFCQENVQWNGTEWVLGAKGPGAKHVRHFLGNVEGWVQFRKLLPGEDVYCGE